MDVDSPELSRERAVSSEPCSTRPNPFDDHEPSARKRQRVSSGGSSRSRSVDATRATSSPMHPTTDPEDNLEMKTISQPPQTPKRPAVNNPVAEPTSSRVTINLRSTRPPESPSSSSGTSPTTPSKMTQHDEDTKSSIEPADDDVTPDPAEQTPSSSSRGGSPQIELVGDGTESEDRTPPVGINIIDDDDMLLGGEPDPMLRFPYQGNGESLSAVARKIARFFECDSVENDDCFCKLATWIDSFLQYSAAYESSWYDNYITYQEFWELFPEIMWGLSRRRSFFGQFLHRSKDGRQAMTELFCQFARLTARFVALDIKMLPQHISAKDNNEEPHLASKPYLYKFSWLLRKEETPHIGRNLESHYRWNWNDDVSLMMNNFLVGGGSISALTILSQQVLSLIPRFPKLVENLTDPSRVVNRAVADAAQGLSDPDASHPQYLETYQQIIEQGYQYYEVMSPGLAFIIEKHVTFLTSEAAVVHVTGLTNLYYCALAFEPYPAQDVLEDHKENHPSLPPVFSSQVISNEWKFEILRKLIISSQMQLRVIGVTTMCSDLLSMFTKNKKDDPTVHPLLLYFANLILRNKLVDYIVGIGSHPEIISESYNIVGFLIATKTYTTQETDTIWRTVMTSEDPRVVEAILRMLAQIVNLHDYEPLLYICKKIGELPVESFTGPMRDYIDRLVRQLIDRRSAENFPSLDAPPYELFVRLIRESSIPRPDAPTGLLEIQNFVSAKLRELMLHGPETTVRRDIYVSCIDDISKKTTTTAGSVIALFGVLRQNLANDLRILTTEHGLTKLLIEDIESNVANGQVSLGSNTPARWSRRELLVAIIMHEPSTITDELGARLWEILVGTGAHSAPEREVGWQILNQSARKMGSRNMFITSCVKDHLPTLDPKCYTVGSLDFAREAISVWMNEAQGDLLDETQHPSNGGIEQLWRMILRAPPNSIEAPAVSIMVELYTESMMIIKMPRSRAHSVHLGLVTRCLKQLSVAAAKLKSFNDGTNSGDDESMVIVATDGQVYEQELIFTRSLILLREFLRSHQSKPFFATPKPKSPLLNTSGEIIGDPLEVKYQTFDGDSSGDIKSLSIGSRNNVAALFLSVKNVSGFKNCKIYHWGKEINIDDTDLHASLEELKIGMGLLLIQRRDGDEITDERLRVKSSTVEHEIMQHSDELWEFLGMEEKMAKEIYYFLIKFPVYGKLLATFADDSTSCMDIFPLGQPFKCLYAIYAIREYLTSRLREGVVDTAALTRAVRLIVTGIKTHEIIDSSPSDEMRCFLAIHLTECLTQLLREPVPGESLDKLLDDTLLKRLLQLLYAAKKSTSIPNSVQLVANTFEAILETSFHSHQFWVAFNSHPKTPQLLFELLLDEPRTALRKNILKQISSRTSWASSLSTLSTIDFSLTLWPFLNKLIFQAVMTPNKCEETLVLALQVFRKLADTSVESVDIEACLLSWGGLLVEHIPHETVGHPENIDPVARCLASLLYWCSSFAKASRLTLPSNTLAVDLLSHLLFPPLTIEEPSGIMVERLPVLDGTTRKMISDTIIFLTRDDDIQYAKAMDDLNCLVPYSEHTDNPYAYDLSMNFDRAKSIRSSTGYVGLRNLSNTCYLNSLFTQLFMNVSFRTFMLEVYVADSSAQKLLQETQKVFSFMQNSLRRFVDPTNLAASIRTYDETSIDVSIQMDVDEFYNLLFDRWESQILSPSAKRKFRSFYGGQLVQQVKSKECPHISERLEPFSAIQCDIKGKTSLQESLQAYVDGEVMEGDNKYKCSTCDRHVNAVKRACLKDIPDNLIFHLKRFDFNLRTMLRSKINDYFNFPHKIDMRPYKVEHLMDAPEETPEDIFELVGILVHSGTAESGHYYSYIRERPSWGATPTWIEFNDDTVLPFDPSSIEASCFGGADYRGPDTGSYAFDKTWSAYMLFYERSSVLQAQQTKSSVANAQPARCEIFPALNNFIVAENESLIRKYCLYDEAHAPFVLRMMDNAQHINKGRCSEDHNLENTVLSATLSHLDQVVGRTKDLPDFSNFMLAITHRLQACGYCCVEFLEWACKCNESLRHLLFRNPDQMVRGEIASAIMLALTKVKNDMSPSTYGLYEDSSDNGEDWDRDYSPRIFIRLLDTLEHFWETFHFHTRAWPEYFGLLVNVAQLGRQETALFLEYGFLNKVLELICADPALVLSQQLTRLLAIISKRTRPVSYENVIALLEVFLRSTNFRVIDSDREKRSEAINDDYIPIDRAEEQLLTQHWSKLNTNILTEKLLLINQNERSTTSIISMLLQGQFVDSTHIYAAIRSGIRKAGSTAQSVRPFLKAALAFCEHVDAYGLVTAMIDHVTKVTSLLEGPDGREHLQFFRDIPNIKRNEDRFTYLKFILNQIPIWAPNLLTYYDSAVRTDTEDVIQQLMARYEALSGDELSQAARAEALVLYNVIRKLGVDCLQYLHIEHIEPKVTAVKATLLSIQAVIEMCRPYYDDTEEEVDLDVQFRDLYYRTSHGMKKLTVEEADEDVSEWDGSDEAFSSSEVMDSIAELGGRDLNDPEVAL